MQYTTTPFPNIAYALGQLQSLEMLGKPSTILNGFTRVHLTEVEDWLDGSRSPTLPQIHILSDMAKIDPMWLVGAWLADRDPDNGRYYRDMVEKLIDQSGREAGLLAHRRAVQSVMKPLTACSPSISQLPERGVLAHDVSPSADGEAVGFHVPKWVSCMHDIDEFGSVTARGPIHRYIMDIQTS